MFAMSLSSSDAAQTHPPVNLNYSLYATQSCMQLYSVAIILAQMATAVLMLGYCRDSAGRRSLRRSRSFKVSDFGTNRKLVCDFLLVNNTNLNPISHNLPDIAHWSNYHFWQRVPLLITNSFSETSENIAMSHILLKTRLFGVHFCRRHMRSIFSHFEFGEITQNKGHYAVQGHSRSPILVPIEKRLPISFAFDRGYRYLSLTHSFGVNP